jgi:hypothetical protein
MKQKRITHKRKQSWVRVSGNVFLSIFVIAVQVILPIAPVFANEDVIDISADPHYEAVGETVPSEEREEAEPEPDIPQIMTESIPQEVVTTDELVLSIENTTSNEAESQILIPSSEAIAANDSSSSNTPEIVVEESDTTSDDGVDKPTDVPEDTEQPVSGGDETDSTTHENGESAQQDILTSTSTDILVGSTTETVVEAERHTVETDSEYIFSNENCAQVANGSFYCFKESAPIPAYTDRVFLAPDADGDSEIFIEKSGEVMQLTVNTHDDGAPYYDENSNTIVFHRLVDARYQVFSLDLERMTEEQLTHGGANSMQPSRYDDVTVWQGWVGNDWEVMMQDGERVEMLTDNTVHDVGPRINGNHIIWQTEKEGGWDIRLYNILTKSIESIDDASGASIENPRLVLVYDAKHENGDTETLGYDLESGKSVSLSSEAPKVPQDLPDPDQTGEDRALINSLQLKTKVEEEDDLHTEHDVPVPLESDTGTSTEDLIIPPYTPEHEGGDEATHDDEVSDPIPDADISEASTIKIPDLVIPEFNEEELTHSDSQM